MIPTVRSLCKIVMRLFHAANFLDVAEIIKFPLRSLIFSERSAYRLGVNIDIIWISSFKHINLFLKISNKNVKIVWWSKLAPLVIRLSLSNNWKPAGQKRFCNRHSRGEKNIALSWERNKQKKKKTETSTETLDFKLQITILQTQKRQHIDTCNKSSSFSPKK